MHRKEIYLRRRERTRPARRGSSISAVRLSLALVVLALVWGSVRFTTSAPTELVVDPELLTRLQTLAEGLHREIVLCLQGETRGSHAVVDNFVMPMPRLSTPTRSSFDRCPSGTIASWHNHPRSMYATAASTDESSYSSRRLCVLSETDIRTAERLRHPFVVVSVDAHTWCWWGIAEVDEFAARSIAPAPPSPERIARAGRTAAWARPSTTPHPID